MRWIRGIAVLLVVVAGLVFGALNPDPIRIDLYLAQFSAATGAVLLGAALVGALLSGLCLWLAVIWPLQRRLRRARRHEREEVGSALQPVEQDPA